MGWCCIAFNILSLLGGPLIAGWGYRHDRIAISMLGRILILALCIQYFISSLDTFILYYFTGPIYQYYKRLRAKDTISEKEHEEVKVMTKNREGAVLITALTGLFLLVSIFSCFHSELWVFQENTLVALLLAGLIVLVFYLGSASSAYWHYADGTIVRWATRHEAIFYFGRDHIVIIIGILLGLFVIYQSVLVSLEGRLLLAIMMGKG